jgi:hypothetical protein
MTSSKIKDINKVHGKKVMSLSNIPSSEPHIVELYFFFFLFASAIYSSLKMLYPVKGLWNYFILNLRIFNKGKLR